MGELQEKIRLQHVLRKSLMVFSLSRFKPNPPSILLYSAQDDSPEFWRPPYSDSVYGGKSTIEASFVEEEIDESRFFKPRRQGEVQNAPVETTTSQLFKSKVLQLKGDIDMTIPPELAELKKDKPIRLGFATIMSCGLAPMWTLQDYDALELRLRVMDGRSWIANLERAEGVPGEMYQALFSGDGQWTSVIIPFNKFYSTFRGNIDGEQPIINSGEITGFGFLMAQRKDGPFCMQLESIRALSMTRLDQEIRYSGVNTVNAL